MSNESCKARSCLFCREETSFLSSDIESKEDEDAAGVDSFCLNLQCWKVPAIVKKQLQPIFIVRKLLDIPEEKCAEYLQYNDNENESEISSSSWFAVCKSCNSTVEESYEIYRKIKRLECDLEKLKVKLKHSILRVQINEDSNNLNDRRSTRGSRELSKARDFVHVDIRKFVTEENAHLLADQGLQVVATQKTEKRWNRRKASKTTASWDFPNSDWQVDSPLDDSYVSDFDTEWQPLSEQESEPNQLPSNVKDGNGDEYDSDYTPSLKIRKRKLRGKTTTRTSRRRKMKKNDDDDGFNNGGSEEVVDKKDRNSSKPVRLTYMHRCNLCVAFFRKITSFEQHEKLHALQTGFPCPYCGWLCFTAKGLSSHVCRKHKTSERKKKRIVSKKQRKPQINKYHYKELDAIPYYCDHCHMIYKSEVLILRHINIYHRNVEYRTCNFCDFAFPTKQLLELHCKEQHPSSSETGSDDVPVQEIKEERQMCEHCSQSFPSKLKLDFHIATYHQDILLTCKICGYKAGRYINFLQHHRVKHNPQEKGNQRFMCQYCPKTFTCLSYLRGHMKAIHFDILDINPLICKECNVTFHAPVALLEHENHVHKKIKGRCCEYCGKAFSRAGDLKRHILLHTATREEQYKKGPFFCQFCEAKFNVRQALYYHLKRHHTDKYAYKCDYCGTGYVTQNTLLQHLRKCKAKKQTSEPVPPLTQTPQSSVATIDVSVKQEANNAVLEILP